MHENGGMKDLRAVVIVKRAKLATSILVNDAILQNYMKKFLPHFTKAECWWFIMITKNLLFILKLMVASQQWADGLVQSLVNLTYTPLPCKEYPTTNSVYKRRENQLKLICTSD